MFDDWSRQEALQLIGIIMATVATIIGSVLAKMIRTVHILINSRLSQLISGAEAQGRIKERDEGEAKNLR